jgi:hypothetical protein
MVIAWLKNGGIQIREGLHGPTAADEFAANGNFLKFSHQSCFSAIGPKPLG